MRLYSHLCGSTLIVTGRLRQCVFCSEPFSRDIDTRNLLFCVLNLSGMQSQTYKNTGFSVIIKCKYRLLKQRFTFELSACKALSSVSGLLTLLMTLSFSLLPISCVNCDNEECSNFDSELLFCFGSLGHRVYIFDFYWEQHTTVFIESGDWYSSEC